VSSPALRPAVFIDRDGTLSEEVGYINHMGRFRLLSFAVDAVRLVNQSGYLAILVTNQAGVARGYFPEPLVEEVHRSVVQRMTEGGAHLDGIFYCPHHPSAGAAPYRQDCLCRKPKPGLLHEAQRQLDVDLARSWVIGDRYPDMQVAWAVGGRGAMVRTGYGEGELVHNAPHWPRQPDLVAENLLSAVTRILQEAAIA
jgi:D-glycero-D-manno-heptose 1,7-bisphosphate phosphatase